MQQPLEVRALETKLIVTPSFMEYNKGIEVQGLQHGEGIQTNHQC